MPEDLQMNVLLFTADEDNQHLVSYLYVCHWRWPCHQLSLSSLLGQAETLLMFS